MSDASLPHRRVIEYLNAEAERRTAASDQAFFTACAAGDVTEIRKLLDEMPIMALAWSTDGATGLHLAIRHPEAVRLLLQRGADPDARDMGDNAPPLFGAMAGPIESVRAFLELGADVHGHGDLHQLELIGAATVFGPPNREIVDLLVRHGARHHVFSAIALGDVALLRRVVAEQPGALDRRLSRFEQEQSALHYVIAPPDGLLGGTFRTGEHYVLLDALIELGAELEARDARGRTPMEVAMLRGDHEAMRRLKVAGAREPEVDHTRELAAPASLAPAVGRLTPMLSVADLEATVVWYQSIGFTLTGSHRNGERLDWAAVSFGQAEIMFVPSSGPTAPLTLWIQTDRLDALYDVFRSRQLERAKAALAGTPQGAAEVRFSVDLHTAFYGQREFGIRDPNGIEVMFCQPVDP